jgi:thymidylate synthase (FAD)
MEHINLSKYDDVSKEFGFVRLDASMADDISVVNAARVSFAKSQQEMDAAAKGLINFLMREKHGTPFEHNSFRFHVKSQNRFI